MVTRQRLGRVSRKSARRGRSFLRNGGSWNSVGPSFRAHHRHGLSEVPHQVTGVAKLGVVGDPLRGFDGEAKTVGHRGRPVEEVLLPRHPVEGVVDLDRVEFRGVPGQHLGIGQLGRIEGALPLLERVPAGPDVVGHPALRSPSPAPRARLCFKASIRSMILPPPSWAGSEVISWPSTFLLMASRTRSRTWSRYRSG